MGKRYLLKGKKGSYVERDRYGRFKKWVRRGKSISMDRRKHAKRVIKSGYGHRGDRKR